MVQCPQILIFIQFGEIAIPKILKYNKTFEKTLIENGKKLLERHQKYSHIKSKDQENVLLFGEFVPKDEFK